jgi:hypothetical protein
MFLVPFVAVSRLATPLWFTVADTLRLPAGSRALSAVIAGVGRVVGDHAARDPSSSESWSQLSQQRWPDCQRFVSQPTSLALQ